MANNAIGELRSLAIGLRNDGSTGTADAMERAADQMVALEAVARAAESAVDMWIEGGRDDYGLAQMYALERAIAALREVRHA